MQQMQQMMNSSSHHDGQMMMHSSSSSQITADDARNIALKDAQVDAKSAENITCNLKNHDGSNFYSVRFYTNNPSTRYTYNIDATDGSILEKKFELNKKALSQLKGQPMSRQQALDMLSQKINGVDKNNIQLKGKKDDGLNIFEGEAYTSTTKYEFKIDVVTGTILEWEETQRRR